MGRDVEPPSRRVDAKPRRAGRAETTTLDAAEDSRRARVVLMLADGASCSTWT
jgi:hypothetical protein